MVAPFEQEAAIFGNSGGDAACIRIGRQIIRHAGRAQSVAQGGGLFRHLRTVCRLPEPVERLPPFVSVQPFYRQKPCRACRLQLFGNAALIVGNDQQQRGQTQGAAFP